MEHRRHLIFKSGVDYDTHYPETINFIPPDEVLAAFEQDYLVMKEQMFYGDQHKEFAEIIERLKVLLRLFSIARPAKAQAAEDK